VLTAKSCNKDILCAAQDFVIATYTQPAALCTCNMPALYICLTLSILLREADVSRYSFFMDALSPAGRLKGHCL
jgi:hypothetical protein